MITYDIYRNWFIINQKMVFRREDLWIFASLNKTVDHVTMSVLCVTEIIINVSLIIQNHNTHITNILLGLTMIDTMFIIVYTPLLFLLPKSSTINYTGITWIIYFCYMCLNLFSGHTKIYSLVSFYLLLRKLMFLPFAFSTVIIMIWMTYSYGWWFNSLLYLLILSEKDKELHQKNKSLFIKN